MGGKLMADLREHTRVSGMTHTETVSLELA
jgi:hypothetical protein